MARISLVGDRRWAVPAAVVAVAALGLAGCGGGSAGDDGTAGTAPAATTPAATSAGRAGAGAGGDLTLDAGTAAGAYAIDLCLSADPSSVSLSGRSEDGSMVDLEVHGGTGTMIWANAANTELANGTVTSLSVNDQEITGKGEYDNGDAFSVSGTCTP